MANELAVVASRVRILDATQRFTDNIKAGVDLTRGQAVYDDNGVAKLARANAVGTAKVAGIVTNDAKTGEPVTLLEHGRLAGYTLDSIDAGKAIYLSEATAGALTNVKPTGATNVVVPVGAVRKMTSQGQEKYILFDISAAIDPVVIGS